MKVDEWCCRIHSQDLLGVSYLMDPLTISGIFIAGIGIGLSSFNWKPQKQEAGLVTCHCECGAKPEPAVQNSSRELLLAVALGFVLGALVVITIQLRVSFLNSSSGPVVVKEIVKGKGKKGVFGSSVPLQLEQ